jgi:hypothetical protein
MDQVSQLVREARQSLLCRLRRSVGQSRVAPVGEFRDGGSDRVVQTTVKRSKLVYLNGLIALERQIRYRLAKIAVAVNDLLYREALPPELEPMLCGRLADLRQDRLPAAGWPGNLAAAHGLRCLLHLQRLDELIQKQRYPVLQVSVDRRGNRP